MQKFRVVELRAYFVEGKDEDDALNRFSSLTDEGFSKLTEDLDNYELSAEPIFN